MGKAPFDPRAGVVGGPGGDGDPAIRSHLTIAALGYWPFDHFDWALTIHRSSSASSIRKQVRRHGNLERRHHFGSFSFVNRFGYVLQSPQDPLLERSFPVQISPYVCKALPIHRSSSAGDKRELAGEPSERGRRLTRVLA